MDKAKLRLSAKEAELVSNADWILTKNEILQKVKWLLVEVQSQQQRYLNTAALSLPSEVLSIPPKISKGENYKGLPYLVLDYPRYFGKDDHFAIRSMFWWGNFFSITLHLSGIYKKKYGFKLERAFILLKQESFFIGIGDNQWEHHFEKSNYLPVDEMNDSVFKNYISDKSFIKLAKKIPLDQWKNAGDILFVSFCKMIGWVTG